MVNFKVAYVSFPRAKFWLRVVRYDVRKTSQKGGHYMTRNQIEYMKVRNQERKDRQDSSARLSELQESKRHNYVTETELNRANLAKEGEESRRTALTAANLQESIRANKARESQNYLVINETNRANLAREREANRSNLAQEAIAAHNASINERNAAANIMNANTNAANADTNAYNATVNANKMLLEDQQRQAQIGLIQQQTATSKAQESLYNIQADLAVPGKTLSDVAQALKLSMDVATLFAK